MSSKVVHAEVSRAPLSVDRTLAAVQRPRVGGVAMFVGVVREVDRGKEIASLCYTAHPTAHDVLTTVAEEVAQAHDVIAVAVQHRVGDLVVGDLAVVIAVGAEHRGPALAACRSLIDELKVRVPIWKEQFDSSGGAQWVGVE